MLNAIFSRWLIVGGGSASLSGIILYSQLGNIVELHVSLAVLNGAASLSISLTLVGLVAALIGSVGWARRAPVDQALQVGLTTGVVTLLLAAFVNINIHGPSAIFLFVVFAGAIGSATILIVAGGRSIYRDRGK
jgi:hypothetical protein